MQKETNRVPLIAIVDDDPDDRLFLKEGFISAGFPGAFLEFTNAVSFKEWIKEHSSEDKCPDILLLDINMPKLNGIEFLQLMANKLDLSRMRLFMISTSANEKDKQACSGYGVHRFFTKPIDISGYAEIAKQCMCMCLCSSCKAVVSGVALDKE